MALSTRRGLQTTGATGDTIAARDWNLLAKRIEGLSVCLTHLLGGEGIHRGVATLVDTGVDGTLVQAGTGADRLILCVLDDSGYAWWFTFVADQTITFDATSGTLNLYAVIDQEAGVSPAAAEGASSDVTFRAASVAPAHSFLLGSGSVTASAFTSWTEDSGARRLSPAYSVSNESTDRTYDANSTTTDELADVLGTLINDLNARGMVG